MEEQGGENQSELNSNAVVKLELDLSMLEHASYKEELNGEDEHGLEEDVELVGLCHVVFLLVVLHESKVGQRVGCSLYAHDLALLDAHALIEWHLLLDLGVVIEVETLLFDLDDD